jgi:hypothetical protein
VDQDINYFILAKPRHFNYVLEEAGGRGGREIQKDKTNIFVT